MQALHGLYAGSARVCQLTGCIGCWDMPHPGMLKIQSMTALHVVQDSAATDESTLSEQLRKAGLEDGSEDSAAHAPPGIRVSNKCVLSAHILKQFVDLCACMQPACHCCTA